MTESLWSPASSGQGVVVPSGATTYRHRLLQWSQEAPSRVTVATSYQALGVFSPVPSLIWAEVTAGVGGAVLRYLVDVGQALSVNAESVTVSILAAGPVPADVNVKATIATGNGPTSAIYSSGSVSVPAGGSVLLDTPPSASRVSLVGPETSDLTYDLLRSGGFVWTVSGDSSGVREGLPVGTQSSAVRLNNAAGVPHQVLVSWEIAS